MDSCEKISSRFVIARRYGTVLFKTAEKVFNQVPGLIESLVERALLLAILSRRDDEFLAGLAEWFENTVFGIIPFVSQDCFGFEQREKDIRSGQVTRLAGRQTETRRIAQRIDCRVDFRA